MYKNELSMDESGFDAVPDIYVKGKINQSQIYAKTHALNIK